jgi:hypothetical protein
MSEEYKILEKNQSNLVNADAEGAITDAQITMLIHDMYKKVYGYEPKGNLEDFLKAKYTEYKFDDVKFIKLLNFMHDLETNKPVGASSQQTNANAANKTTLDATTIVQNDMNKTSGQNVANKTTTNAKEHEVNSTLNANNSTHTNTSSSHTAYGPGATHLYHETDNKSVPFGSSWNPPIKTGSAYCDKDPYNINKFYDSLYENHKIATAADGKCTNTVIPNRNELAEKTQKRNMEELQYSCSRNTYATLVDEEMMSGHVNAYDKNVMPNYRNTRYGSFLDDADNTKVGSIMPKFIFKEYVE